MTKTSQELISRDMQKEPHFYFSTLEGTPTALVNHNAHTIGTTLNH